MSLMVINQFTWMIIRRNFIKNYKFHNDIIHLQSYKLMHKSQQSFLP